MRRLLRLWREECGAEIDQVGRIPVQPRDREAFDELLIAGTGRAALRIGSAGELFEIQIERKSDGSLVALRHATSVASSRTAQLGKDRLYALAAVAEGLVHDLNNMLGAAVGFSEHLASVVRNPDERMFLEYMREGTQTGVEFTNKLLRLLRQPPRARSVVAVQSLVGEALSLFRGSALLSGNEIRTTLPEQEVLVRVVPEEVVQCLLHMLLFSRASSPAGGSMEILVERLEAGGGDFQRKCARIAVRDRGDPADGKLLQQMLEHPHRDLLEVARRLSGDGRSLLGSSLAMLRNGGMLRYDGGSGGLRSVSLLLPLARKK